MQPSLRAAWLKRAALLPWHPRATPQSLVPRRIATTSAENPAPVDLPRLLVRHGHKHHNSLATFLEYVDRTKLSPLAPIYVGTHYEYTTALAFMRLGFSLIRVGSKDDAGIDLIGHWVLAPLSEPLPVIIQCKARKCSIGPGHVRELEGSFQGTPPSWKGKPVLGLIVTTMKATKGTLETIARSRWPMGFVMMSKHGLIQQFVWNRAASAHGLEGVGVSMRHTPRALLAESEILETDEEPTGQKKRASKFANTGTRKDIQMTWMGSPIFPERTTLDQNTLDMIRTIEIKFDPMTATPAPRGFPRRGQGRPKKDEDDDAGSTPLLSKTGRKPTRHLAPTPRGGQIPVPRTPPPTPPRTPRPRGRPPGVKSKPKTDKDAG